MKFINNNYQDYFLSLLTKGLAFISNLVLVKVILLNNTSEQYLSFLALTSIASYVGVINLGAVTALKFNLELNDTKLVRVQNISIYFYLLKRYFLLGIVSIFFLPIRQEITFIIITTLFQLLGSIYIGYASRTGKNYTQFLPAIITNILLIFLVQAERNLILSFCFSTITGYSLYSLFFWIKNCAYIGKIKEIEPFKYKKAGYTALLIQLLVGYLLTSDIQIESSSLRLGVEINPLSYKLSLMLYSFFGLFSTIIWSDVLNGVNLRTPKTGISLLLIILLIVLFVISGFFFDYYYNSFDYYTYFLYSLRSFLLALFSFLLMGNIREDKPIDKIFLLYIVIRIAIQIALLSTHLIYIFDIIILVFLVLRTSIYRPHKLQDK